MKIVNISKNTVLADKARIADTFWARLIGLLNRNCLFKGEALVLTPSNSIHSFFMRFSFDAIFVDRQKKVVAILAAFKPFRISRIYFRAYSTIELPCETIRSTHTQIGDIIEFTPD
jgi:hypothetical protein